MVDEEEIKEIEEHIDTLKKEKQKKGFSHKLKKTTKKTFWRFFNLSKKGAKFTKEKVEKYSPKVEQAGKKAYKKTLKGIKYAGYAGAEGVEAVGEGALATTRAFGSILRRGPSPIQTFMFAWSRINKNIRFLIFILTLVAILFIPVGIFPFIGWAVAAAGMFLISLIYWGFANLFNGIAYVIVSIINGVTTIVMKGVVAFVEWVIGFIDNGWVWTNGRQLVQHSLITYKQIATVPALITPVKPNTFDATPLIIWLFKQIGGEHLFASFDNIWMAFGEKIGAWITTSPWWLLALVGISPIIILIVALYLMYRKAAEEYAISQL